MTAPSLDYNYKNKYVENGVEDCLRWFDNYQFFEGEDLSRNLKELKK
jgi:hypothetical protein